MLNYNKLKYFTVVARHLNISTAAEELYIGQPALSIQIKELERELGVSLFIRSNRKLTLTEAGSVLYDEVHAFFDREQALIQRVRDTAIRSQSNLKIGTLGTDIIYYLPQIIQSFQETHPSIHIELRRMNIGSMTEAWASEEIDIGFQLNSDYFHTYDKEKYEAHPLQQGRLQIAMAATHPLAGRKSIRLADLQNCKIAIQERKESPIPYLFLLKACQKAGFKPNIAAEYTFVEPMLTMVSMGDMVTISSDLAPLRGLDNIRLVDFEESVPISLDIVWKKKTGNTAVLPFVRHVIDMGDIFHVNAT